MPRRPTLAARAEALLAGHWWQPVPSALARALKPLAALYGALAARNRRASASAAALPVPVIVVGNFVAGGAGKTPTVIALVAALRAAGRRPGVISRGHGRRDGGLRAVSPDADPAAVGDEPLLIRRRTGVPVWVGRDRRAAALALCGAHPEVDLLVADDGLQHRALARDVELVVFDERGVGNGLLLPAGPLREALPSAAPARMRVLYTGARASTPMPGALALRHLELAWPLADWTSGNEAGAVPITDLRGRPLLAVAGMAAPEKFFGMLEALGLRIERLPLPDHFDYRTLPWPDPGAEIVTTEKDAVKLDPQRLAGTRVWVLPLDLQVPAALVEELLAMLPAPSQPLRPANGPP